jgi:hypothetical protein
LPKIKLFEISATIARSFALPSQSMIHKQFLSRDGIATILPPLHCHRQKSIARVSVALRFPYIEIISLLLSAYNI